MTIEYSQSIILNEQHEISLTELCDLSGLSSGELNQLVYSGVLIPNNPADAILHFNSRYVTTIRALSRLKQDFELESNSLGLMLVFLERIQMLEQQLNRH